MSFLGGVICPQVSQTCSDWHIPNDILHLKMELRPQQARIPTSQTVLDVPVQTQMIYQDVRRNSMQAYIKSKAY